MKMRDTLFLNKHGASEFDVKVASVRKLANNPNKRYFTIKVDGAKDYYLNLIEARMQVKANPDEYREWTQADIEDELATRTTKPHRDRWADVIDRDNLIAVFQGKRWKLVEEATAFVKALGDGEVAGAGAVVSCESMEGA